MPNRHGQDDDYRYGFAGQEKDDEIKGKGNSLNFTFRMYDSRIARFISIDPQSDVFPFLSPYQYASNCPIACRDLEGLQSDKQFNATDEIAHRTALLHKIQNNPRSQKLTLAEAQLISTKVLQSNGASGLPEGYVEVRFNPGQRADGNDRVTNFDHLYLKLKTAAQIKADVNEIVSEQNKENNPTGITDDPPTDNNGTDNGSVDLEPTGDQGDPGIKKLLDRDLPTDDKDKPVRLRANATFNSWDSKIIPNDKFNKKMEAIATALKDDPNLTASVRGNGASSFSSINPSVSGQTGSEVSLKRANSIKAALIDRGVPASQITTRLGKENSTMDASIVIRNTNESSDK